MLANTLSNSGLDAFTAQNVMNTLKEIATSGRTVIVSVHQPRSDIWNLFDNVLLLVKGGHTGKICFMLYGRNPKTITDA